MARFISKKKLSKKAQKELNRQRRVTWEFSPVTKTVASKKLYNRKKAPMTVRRITAWEFLTSLIRRYPEAPLCSSRKKQLSSVSRPSLPEP